MSIDIYDFEGVGQFKYLRATIIADNNVTEAIKRKIQAGNQYKYV